MEIRYADGTSPSGITLATAMRKQFTKSEHSDQRDMTEHSVRSE